MNRIAYRAMSLWLASLIVVPAGVSQSPRAGERGPEQRQDAVELPTLRVEAVRQRIRAIGERWRLAPAEPSSWREAPAAERTGRMIWGYDAIDEMRRLERDRLTPDAHPGLEPVRPVTVFRVRRR
jgi:hypothetical protein